MSSITANERQVGGDHYMTPNGALQHWDVAHEQDVPYLLAVASKYIARHDKKDGRQDLEKAIHYLEKWLEGTFKRIWYVDGDVVLEWAAAADLSGPEIHVLYTMLCRRKVDQALLLTRDLLEQRYPTRVDIPEYPLEGIYGPRLHMNIPKDYVSPDWANSVHHRPGTPEDGGHHARQAEEEPEEEIRHWSHVDIIKGDLPESLSHHEWQHRCALIVQEQYRYNSSAARWVLVQSPSV